MMCKTALIVLWLLLTGYPFAVRGGDGRFGWPLQKAPKKVIVCRDPSGLSERMLLESMAGVAAQRVNRDEFDEMIWIETKNDDYETLFRQTVEVIRPVQVRNLTVWDALAYLKKRKVLAGYVLYRRDTVSGPAYSLRPGMDESSNAATVYAAVLGGVLVDESLEPQVKKMGLRMLKDAREIDMQTCFAENRSKLNNCAALAVDPVVPNLREYAIAHKLMLYYGTDPFTETILEWVRPLSPILGWNCGDEDAYTGAISRWGHYNTASNWCRNLAFLSVAGSLGARPVRSVEAGPDKIDFSDTSSFHAYLMSDGDNMQWTMGNFLRNATYFANPWQKGGGLSWSSCPVNLSVMSPFTWNALVAGQAPRSSLVEYGGGYQYPDLFAINRPDRPALLREFARRLNDRMKCTGVTVFGFICKNVRSEAARVAFRIYAEEIDSLTGMLAVQYYPYELDGEVQWFPNRQGIDIPVVSARYCIWNTTDERRPRAGSPEYVSAQIAREARETDESGKQLLSWTVVHAWSQFDTNGGSGDKPLCGADAAFYSADRLPPAVKVVSVGELLWRMRMKYRPGQTGKLIDRK